MIVSVSTGSRPPERPLDMPSWVGECNNLGYLNHAERLTHLNCGQEHSTDRASIPTGILYYIHDDYRELSSRMQPSFPLFSFVHWMHILSFHILQLCGYRPSSCYLGSLLSRTAALNLRRRAATPQHCVQDFWPVFCSGFVFLGADDGAQGLAILG